MSPAKRSFIRLLCLLMIVAAVAGKSGISKRASMRRSKIRRMVDGHPVMTNKYNFIVSLRVLPKELHRCGGFLISRRHALTTATCIYPLRGKELYAYVNPLKLDNQGTYVRVTDMKAHPNFSVSPQENDIAFLTLDKEQDLKPPVIPEWTELPARSEIITFGWGYDRTGKDDIGNFSMHMLKLHSMPNGLCTLVHREYLSSDIICGASNTQFATNPADVGTPLIYQDKEELYAVGMLVKETDDAVNAAPYMKLNQYRNWIHNMTEDFGKPPMAATATTTTTATEKPTDNPTVMPSSTETDLPEVPTSTTSAENGEDNIEQPA